MTIVVNVSDAKVSADPAAVVTTYSLGSCIGVTMYDPVMRCGGMLHYQLPTSTLDAARARANPCMFADTGIIYLLEQLYLLGAEKKRLKVRLAGGAEIIDTHGVFNIGRRNHAAVRKLLWQHGLFVQAEDVGGSAPRNLYLHIADGTTTIRSAGEMVTL